MYGIIYMIINKVNGKKYIGKHKGYYWEKGQRGSK